MFGVRGLSPGIIKDVSLELFQLVKFSALETVCESDVKMWAPEKLKATLMVSSFPFMV